MAKKTSIKVSLVPEAKPDSPFFLLRKKTKCWRESKSKAKSKKIQSRYKKT